MNKIQLDALKKDLSAVLKKHNVYIAFQCSDSSDLHGIYNDKIAVVEKGTDEVVISNGSGFHMYDSDIK